MNATTSEDSEYETLEEDNGDSSKSSRSRHSSFSDQLSDGIGLEDEREDGDGQEVGIIFSYNLILSIYRN